MNLTSPNDCCVELQPSKGPYRPSLSDNLERQKQELEERLGRINQALDALKANPEVLKVLELVSRV